MAKIINYLNNIKNAMFGKDVRSSIHDGIAAINEEVESTTARQKVLDSTFEQLTINAGSSNAEVVAARVDESGKSHDTLGKRLNSVDSQIKENENKFNDQFNTINSEISSINLNKMDKKTNSISVNQIDKNLGKIDETFLSDTLLQQIAGNTPIGSVPADYSITNIKLANNSVSSAKLDDKFNYVKNLGASDNLDNITRAGVYLCIGKPINSPSEFGTSSYYLTVENYNTFYVQRVSLFSKPARQLCRQISGSGEKTEWSSNSNQNVAQLSSGTDLNSLLKVGVYLVLENATNCPQELTNKTITVKVVTYGANDQWIRQEVHHYRETSSIYYRTIYVDDDNLLFDSWQTYQSIEKFYSRENIDGSNGGDLNNVFVQGNYLLLNKPLNLPFTSSSGTLEVQVVNNRWIKQTATALNNPRETYIRTIDTKVEPIKYSDWVCIIPPLTISKLAGKKIVNFGDSIFGNTQGADSISGQIASITGAIVYNCGFGGCRMSKHTGYWDAFSMYNLVDAIISKDFTAQETGANASDTSCPSYFKQTVELLKTIDFNKVDYITIAYGTNDYTASKNLDVGKGDKNIDAYAGALRYSIEKLLTNFPHIKLLICTPIWRWWEAEEGISSDEKEYGGNTLLDYRDKVIEVCNDYHVPYLNGYDNSLINELTKHYYFTSPDGTHPNAKGNKRYAEILVGKLETM